MKRERTPERKVDREDRERFSWWRLKKVSVKDRSGSARGNIPKGREKGAEETLDAGFAKAKLQMFFGFREM